MPTEEILHQVGSFTRSNQEHFTDRLPQLVIEYNCLNL